MGALPRPDVPAGPHRDLVHALHDLHHRAGWPSLRALAARAGVSHTTVSKVLSAPSLPPWGTLELLVEAMGGSVPEFHDLWLDASTPTDAATAQPRIAGRRAELIAVRRHLTHGSGMLLVTGEAGIGKTNLVTAAAQATDVLVATGHCLPLSSEVPLLPIADALSAVMRADEGSWLEDALTACPPFVAGALFPLLPTGAPPETGQATDAFARHRMFTAVDAVLGALGSARPLALLLEDLHWADLPTLALLEHLLAVGTRTPVIATWRSDDPDVGAVHAQWLGRVQRRVGVATLTLVPLSRDETAEQLVLGGHALPDDDLIDRVYSVGQGLPLFTEQLGSAPDDELPRQLGDLLDHRLGELEHDAWLVARVLGIAERSLQVETLRLVSGLDSEEQQHALTTLVRRRLVGAGASDDVRLAHPLLARAIRGRLVPGESRSVHALLAETLGHDPAVEPGEVAHHWQHADEPDRELAWRIAAARRAQSRLAARERLENWVRAFHLSEVATADSGLDRWEVLCEVVDSAFSVPDFDVARDHVELALTLDLDDAARLAVLRRAGRIIGLTDPARGLGYLDEAVELLDSLPPSREAVDVLLARIAHLTLFGQFEDVRADLRRARAVLVELEDGPRLRGVVMWEAWHAMAAGDHQRARELIGAAGAISDPDPDPLSEVEMAVNVTDILLKGAASSDSVVEAATPALENAARWHLQDHPLLTLLRSNVVDALLRAGQVERAADVVGADDPSALARVGPLHSTTLAAVLIRRGDLDGARARCVMADSGDVRRDANWAETVPHRAEIELWTGDVDAAISVLDEALDVTMSTENSRAAAPVLALAARAHADLLTRNRAVSRERDTTAARLRARVRDAAVDPLGPAALGLHATTWARQWEAELHRIELIDHAAEWVDCARAWDAFTGPHHAAYCRWRAAQAALRDGQGTLAGRLLARAAADAREHVPLGEAIAATRAGAR